MGMSIDKAIDRLEDLHFEQDNWEFGELTEDCLLNREALRLAVNTMQKHQKIEQILDDCLLDDWEILKSIREVVEDGKIDSEDTDDQAE